MRFSEALDPATVAGSTLVLALAGADGQPTGAVVRATVTLTDAGTLVVLQPALPLSPGRSYVATFAGGVRDVGGTPYAGGPVSWSFTTSTAVVLGGEVHPELFHIERPVDGVAVITGAPGALPVAPAGFTPWSVSPVIEEAVADPVVDSFSADSVGGVSATVGHPPGHPGHRGEPRLAARLRLQRRPRGAVPAGTVRDRRRARLHRPAG